MSGTSCCSPAQEPSQESEETQPCCCEPEEQAATTCCPEDKSSTECCVPEQEASTCCPSPARKQLAGYRLEPFVVDWLDTEVGSVPVVSSSFSQADRFGRWAMRWGIGRDHYSVTPGLYALGNPDQKSEVLVSANYKLSFDLLRSSVGSLSAWILVLDTKGVNVWCAAGKGTFGTAEIIHRVEEVRLDKLVTHRRLIVPQLGAPGVSAHEVKKACKFNVCYGPVRVADVPAYLAAQRQATPEMRRVHFTLLDRTVLTPVEITILAKQIFIVAIALMILGGVGNDIFSLTSAATRGSGAILAGLTGLIAGAVFTPFLLPWLPGRAFALKGIWPGLSLAFLLGATVFRGSDILNILAMLLQVTAISSYTAMNFTGSSTYTSPSGVEKEMRMAIPGQLAAVVLALILWLWAAF